MAKEKIVAKAPKRELTPKQEMFVREYLVDLNATQAAIRAGYSAKTADVQASRLLGNVQIARAIQAGMDKRAANVEITAEEVLGEIKKLALSDIRDIFDENGRLLPVHMLPDHVAKSVSSIEVVTTRIPGSDPVEVEHTSKIRFWDKRGSLELLGKHLKLFTERVELNVGDELADKLQEARARAQK